MNCFVLTCLYLGKDIIMIVNELGKQRFITVKYWCKAIVTAVLQAILVHIKKTGRELIYNSVHVHCSFKDLPFL